MTTRTLRTTAFMISDVKPNYVYGQPASLRVEYGHSAVLLRAGIPTDIPEDATVISATLRLNLKTDLSSAGAVTLNARRNTTPLRATATFNNAPTWSGVTASDSLTNPVAASWFELDVTSNVQQFVSGTLDNYGWRLSAGSSTAGVFYLRGATASVRPPELVLVYAVPGAPPTDLYPDGGAVATDEPTVTFTVPDETVAVQVQVDPAADAAAPDFDSGEVAATAGLLDLAATAYAPAWTGGEATFWRARYKDADLGWSDWSTWATYTFEPQDALTILTPDAAPADPTPTVSWSFGGTQTTWRARLLDATGKQLASSGYRAGTDTAWTPAKGFTSDGQSGTVEVMVRDDLDRLAVPGFGTWAKATLPVVVTLDGTVPPMDALFASSDETSPAVVLTGTRSEIPDEVVIFRNGRRIARLDGTDVFTGTAFAWTDWTAPPNVQATYRVAPVTLGKVAAGGPTAILTPTCRGLWLIDPDDDRAAVIWGDDPGTWDRTDVAAVHQTLSGRNVRRRLGRPLVSGSLAGTLVDVGDYTAQASRDLLEDFADLDAGHVFRLIAGARSIPVTIGDVTIAPTPVSGGRDLVETVTFAFWEVED